MQTRAALFFALLFAFAHAPDARAWSSHHYITRSILKDRPELQYTVKVKALDPTEFGFKSVRAFNESIKIIREYDFPFQRPAKFGDPEGEPTEKPGDEMNAVDVLSKYSDEPDWGMDLELFDEYPKLWNDAYKNMGGRKDTPSQAFRHMYWPEFDWLHPFNTFKISTHPTTKPMGEAPERARIFLEFARKAKEKHDPYWNLRFIANALHYLEDCSEPFHTTQIPFKSDFMEWPKQKKNPKAVFTTIGIGKLGIKVPLDYPLQVTHIVAYYHFSFEDYIAKLMGYSSPLTAPPAGVSAKEGETFDAYLASPQYEAPSSLDYSDRDIAEATRAMAHLGMIASDDAGRAAAAFFPTYPNADYHQDLIEDKALTPAWWTQTLKTGSSETTAKRDYFAVVSSMFEPLGQVVRAVVEAERSPSER
jgi:hypothetical protein